MNEIERLKKGWADAVAASSSSLREQADLALRRDVPLALTATGDVLLPGQPLGNFLTSSGQLPEDVAPTSALQRYLRAGLSNAGIGAVMGGTVAGPFGAGVGGLSGAAGGIAQQAAADLGGGPWIQGGANFLASLLADRGLTAAAGRARALAASGGQAGNSNAVSQVQDILGERLPVERRAQQLAALEGPGPTTVSALGSEAGEALPSMEATLSASDPRFSTRMSLAKNAETDRIAAGLSKVRGPGGMDPAAAYAKSRKIMLSAKRKAWAMVRPEIRDQIPVGSGGVEASTMVTKYADHPRLLPPAARKMAKWSEAGSWRSIDDIELMRADLGSWAAEAERKGNAAGAQNAYRLRRVIDNMIDTFEPPPGSSFDVESLQTARNATKMYYRQFDRSMPSTKAFSGGSAAASLGAEGMDAAEVGRAARSIIGRPAEAKNMHKIMELSGTDAVNGFEAAVFDELMGGPIDARPGVKTLDFNANRAYANWRQNAKTAKAVFGKERYVTTLELLDSYKKLNFTLSGTPQAARSTGSRKLLALVVNTMINGPTVALQNMTGLAGERWLGSRLTNSTAAKRLLYDAMLDKQLARDLLSHPNAAQFPAWQTRMEAALARAGIRASMVPTQQQTQEAPR